MTKTNGTLIGIISIFAGGFVLLGQNFNISQYLWPFFIIFPGLLLFTLMYLGGKNTAGLAVPASIVTAVGLILFSQNITGRFETWAYAWALVQVAIGMGLNLQGRLQDSDKLQNVGSNYIVYSLSAFAIFAFFFEFLIFQTWTQGLFGRYLLPAALIAAGFSIWKKRSALES